MPPNLCIDTHGTLCWIGRHEDEVYFHPVRCLSQNRTTREVQFHLTH